MPLIKKSTSIPANSTVDNVISGSVFEYMPWNAALSIGVTAAAAGLLMTINSGSDTILEESPVNPTTNPPKIPDDIEVTDRAMAGERLVIKVRNTTAGAVVAYTLVDLKPV